VQIFDLEFSYGKSNQNFAELQQIEKRAEPKRGKRIVLESINPETS
jgi:hypothetical protein